MYFIHMYDQFLKHSEKWEVETNRLDLQNLANSSLPAFTQNQQHL